jgi:hypothetical protein
LDDKIYAISENVNGNYVDFNELYDPMSDAWVTLESMPASRANFVFSAPFWNKLYPPNHTKFKVSFNKNICSVSVLAPLGMLVNLS